MNEIFLIYELKNIFIINFVKNKIFKIFKYKILY